MKNVITLSILILVFLVTFGTETRAQRPKEDTFSVTWAYSGTYKILPLGQERVQINYEIMGPGIADTSDDLLHDSSFHCLGAGQAVKGETEHSGSCVSTCPDGDQIFWTYKATGKLGGNGRGTTLITGGTGKLTGIQGSAEYLEFNMRPAADGTFQGYTRAQGQHNALNGYLHLSPLP